MSLARSERATVFMVLLGAFQVLLGRYSRQTDIVVGTAIAGRTQRASEGLIGCFVNVLALRTDLSGDPLFTEVLGRVREVTLGAYAHQDSPPFERLVAELQPERHLLLTTSYQASFTWQNVLARAGRAAGAAVPAAARGAGDIEARFVAVYARERRDFAGEASQMRRICSSRRPYGGWRDISRGCWSRLQQPRVRIGDLQLLTATEQRQLLEEWNATATSYPQDRCIHELFEEAQRPPGCGAGV